MYLVHQSADQRTRSKSPATRCIFQQKILL